MDFEYIQATDFDRAWLNFELDLPLEPMPGGRPNPFYVNRPGNPISQLERMLLRSYRQPPKYFFSGHRGCGKSTGCTLRPDRDPGTARGTRPCASSSSSAWIPL